LSYWSFLTEGFGLGSAKELGSIAIQIIIYFVARSFVLKLAQEGYLPNALEARSLHWEQNFDVCTAGKYPFKVHPTSLHIDPHIKQCIDAIQFLFPCEGFFLEHLHYD
jgi:hypothetical protein